MAGELWRQRFQIGKETTPGTGVAATRIMYFTPDSRLSRERGARPHKFATASRDNVRAFTLGPNEIGGSLKMPLSASEIVEFLLLTIAGGVTPTTPGGTTPRLWTFTPGTSLEAATVEWDDGARVWEANGVYGSKLTIEGNVKEQITASMEVMGLAMPASSLTGSLTEGTPDFIEGWETSLYIDAIGGTPGTTNIAGTLINWSIEIDNMMTRKFFADNTLDTGALVIGELGVKAKLTFEAAPAAALTEFNNWNAATQRLVRLEFGENEVIEGAFNKFVKVDLPGAWDAVDLGGSDEGTRTYELGLQYVYDVTNAFGLQILAQNARTAAWADR